MTMEAPSNPIDNFERRVVFRIARTFFFGLAIIALLVFVGSGAAAGLGLVPFPVAPVPPPPPLPAKPTLDLASVESFVAQKAAPQQRESPSPPSSANRSTTASRDNGVESIEKSIDDELSRLKLLFQSPDYSWEDVIEVRCAVNSPYGCLQKERRITQLGIQSIISELLRTTKRRDEKLATLQALSTVLAGAPVERRGSLIVPTVELYRQSTASYFEALAEREAAIRKDEAEHREREQKEADRKETMLKYGGTGLLIGFASVVLLSLFLAFLAMERHLRLLETELQRLRGVE